MIKWVLPIVCASLFWIALEIMHQLPHDSLDIFDAWTVVGLIAFGLASVFGALLGWAAKSE